MNKSLVLFVGLIFAFCGSAVAQKAQKDVLLDGLKGDVEKVVTETYEAIATDAEMLQRGDIMDRVEVLYLKNGQRKSMTFLSSEEDVMFRSRYKHDGFGITILEHVVDNSENIVGRTYYSYDKDFYLIESYVEDAERQVESRVKYKYDSHGRVAERTYSDASGSTFRREVLSYGQRGNMLRMVTFDRSGNKMRETRYEYDSHAMPVTITQYDYTEAEPEMTVTLFRYRYDGHGNWIQKTEYIVGDSGNPEAQMITERNISYF